MLKILDRYFLSRYLGTFFFILLLFAMLAIVVDLSQKLEDFTAKDGPTLAQTVMMYYANFVPYIIGLLIPIYTLITVIFFTSRMAAQSEIIAMTGNGINFYRLLWPYFLGAMIISTLHFFGNHYLFPQANKVRVDFENTYIWKHNFDSPSDNIHLFTSRSEEIYVQHFNRRDSTGRNFMLSRYDSSGVRRPYILQAKRLEFLGQENRWRLRDCFIRETEGMTERVRKVPQIDTTLLLKTTDLVRRDNLKEAMTSPELGQFIADEYRKGSGAMRNFEIEYHRRSADAFTNLILTLIGFSVASRKVRGGMGWNLVVGILIGAVYVFMSKFSAVFATNGGLNPSVAVWIPNLLFSVIGVFLLFRAQ
jgi:lipopolysaccharide export system permease protein